MPFPVLLDAQVFVSALSRLTVDLCGGEGLNNVPTSRAKNAREMGHPHLWYGRESRFLTGLSDRVGMTRLV